MTRAPMVRRVSRKAATLLSISAGGTSCSNDSRPSSSSATAGTSSTLTPPASSSVVAGTALTRAASGRGLLGQLLVVFGGYRPAQACASRSVPGSWLLRCPRRRRRPSPGSRFSTRAT